MQEVHHGKNSNQITKGYSFWRRWQNWRTCLLAMADKILFRNVKYCYSIYILHAFINFNLKYCIITLPHIFLNIFAAPVYLCIYFPDNDLLEFKTYRRDMSNKWLFITDCITCWIRYRITLNIIQVFKGLKFGEAYNLQDQNANTHVSVLL